MSARPDFRTLQPLISPKSVAIIGASDDVRRIGGRPIAYMKEAGFSGTIWPVNPKRESIQGLPAYRSITDVPGSPDACIVAVQGPLVPDTLEACADKGVQAAIVYSSGFSEMGEEGEALQAQVTEIARRRNIRVLGPNCLGMFNAHNGWMATFSSSIEHYRMEPGPVSLATQSGAYGSHCFTLMRQKGVKSGIWLSTGNEADVEVADVIHYLAHDETTKVIVAYAEGIRDGEALINAFEAAAEAQKPVIFMKVGRSEVGAEAAASHTASLAGSDAVYDGLFEQYGVLRVDSTDQMIDAAYAASRGQFPTGKKLGIVTISGGVGVQMADAAETYEMDVPPMPDEAQRQLKEILPFAAARNPVDITAQAFNDISLIGKNMQIMMDVGGYDIIVAFFTMVASSRYIADGLIATLEETKQKNPDNPVLLSLIGPQETVELYERSGYAVFEDPTRMVAAASALCGFGMFFNRADEADAPTKPGDARDLPVGPVSEPTAMTALSSWGVPFVRHQLATSRDQAIEAARAFGGKVVLKIASPQIAHKTEVGGVIVGVEGDEVADAFDTLMERVGQAAPSASLEGVMVAEMAPSGVEVVVGVQRDPTFGPVVMVGLGGVLVEVLKDVAFRVAPFGEDEALRMIESLKGVEILRGVRGAAPADIPALAKLLAAISTLAFDQRDRLESLDLNPVRVLPEGQGLVALDALLVTE